MKIEKLQEERKRKEQEKYKSQSAIAPKKKLSYNEEAKLRSKVFDKRLKTNLNHLYLKQEKDKMKDEHGPAKRPKSAIQIGSRPSSS